MATITKAELAGIIAKDVGIARMTALKAVDAAFDAMRESIVKGNRIEIRGFGVWRVRETNRKPNARNPKTSEVIDVPARRNVRFKPGKEIKKELDKPI